MFSKGEIKSHPNEKHLSKLATNIPTSSTLWCYITASVGWPRIQLLMCNNRVEFNNIWINKNVYVRRPLFLLMCIAWAILPTLICPNTYNIPVIYRFSSIAILCHNYIVTGLLKVCIYAPYNFNIFCFIYHINP